MPRYLDWNASNPINRAVFEEMQRYFLSEYGNASSRTHVYGLNAQKAVTISRSRICSIVDADESEVIFTSGATESDNLAILGLAEYGIKNNKRHILISNIEHKAVLEPAKKLASQGFQIEYIPTGKDGRVKVDHIAELLRSETLLVSIMHVNNETGIIQPIDRLAHLLSNSEAFLHVDAAQGFCKERQMLTNKRIDLISISGHKIEGPMGIGALIARRRNFSRIPLNPIMYGGGQEGGLRPGTLPVPLIVGLGFAAQQMFNDKQWWSRKLIQRAELLSQLGDRYTIVGDQTYSLPNCFSIILDDWDSEAYILSNKEKWALSNGSACNSSKIQPSHVLEAMSLDSKKGAVRFSY